MQSMMLCVSEDGDSARSRRDQPGSVSDPPVGQLECSRTSATTLDQYV